MKKRLLGLAALAMMLAPLGASAAVFVGDPYWGFYGRPYWGPGYYGGYYRPYGYSGEIKIHTKVKTGEVFINGAFAGDTHHNKSMHLRPGTYTIEVREMGKTRFSQKVYVAPGRTLHLHPDL